MISMVRDKLAHMSGVGVHRVGHNVEHNPHHSVQCAGMNEDEMREFMREEQREGMHPSLKGKRF